MRRLTDVKITSQNRSNRFSYGDIQALHSFASSTIYKIKKHRKKCTKGNWVQLKTESATYLNGLSLEKLRFVPVSFRHAWFPSEKNTLKSGLRPKSIWTIIIILCNRQFAKLHSISFQYTLNWKTQPNWNRNVHFVKTEF